MLPLPRIRLHQVTRRFEARDHAHGLLALDRVDLAVPAGRFTALLGPSGCGKSTVLRLVAGLDDPDEGEVQAPARDARGPARTAFVFQDATLMPWASVADNVALPLRLRGERPAVTAPRVAEVLARVGLQDFAAARPAQLSGGMRMRAALARALVDTPEVLLMDEPFAALDEITRQRLQADLLSWWERTAMSVLFVTHSVQEAVFLAQEVQVMAARPGRVSAVIPVPGPARRDAQWRHDPAFHATCREVARALAIATGEEAA